MTGPAAVEHIAAATGSSGLWGLFNNAGISVAAPLEFVTTDDLRRQLEINVVGQLAVTRAFIPLLRIARDRILTTGSVAGFIAMPGLGPYAMSKHAMEAFSDSLRRELRPWGIEVSLLEPGTIATDIWQKGLTEFDQTMRAPPPGLVGTYGGLLNSMHELAQKSVRHALLHGRGLGNAALDLAPAGPLDGRAAREAAALGLTGITG
ncbi:MAG: SDR family NAD(P)-dependent oxidoreductase [Steroidobacteraceae bacterium]